ncbi:MAG TPA: hypothetical protein PLV39_14730 [Fimbriimonadaceae bacterium]|nr:hypothetical protein [Fimbriimonadaceae bacterium]
MRKLWEFAGAQGSQKAAAAVMAVLIEKMPLDEAAKAAHDAADAMLAELHRRDRECREAEERDRARADELVDRIWPDYEARNRASLQTIAAIEAAIDNLARVARRHRFDEAAVRAEVLP